MMLREAIVVAVALFQTFLLAVYAEKGGPTCIPSSCGEIRNIRPPFRLTTDPSGCGKPRYELACENNHTLRYSLDLRYNVASISYKPLTIRLVDPGVKKGNCFSSPLHSTPHTLDSDTLRYTNTIILMECEQPISDDNYIPINPCNSSNLTSPSSSSSSKPQPQSYAYALVGGEHMAVGDINCSCTLGKTILIQKLLNPNGNLSMSDLQEAMLLGFELQFSYNLWNLILEYFYPVQLAIKSISQGFFFQNIRFLFDGYVYSPEGYLYAPVIVVDAVAILQFLGLIIVGRALLGILCMFAYLIYKFRQRHLSLDDDIERFLHNHQNLQQIKYSYSEIKKMTHGFKDKLGQGGFGSVYKGKLKSGRIVAVKMLNMSKSNGQDFINEVATIGRIHHVNVARLVGFCIERSKWALVYEFMSNGSLDKFVLLDQGNNNPLSWETLYKIAIGVGRGIEYLHRGCDMQILHFDIKPHNILLNQDFIPKVSDFGLAKLYSTDESIVSITAARGTLGYMAPELFYNNIGGVSFKADVYSFGMLLLEMVGKRKNLNAFAKHSSQIYFPTWIYNKYNRGEEMEIGDATRDERKYVMKMVVVALWCIQMKPIDRPSMSNALEMLEGEIELLKMPPKPILYPMEMSLEDHEQPMELVPCSNSIGTITIDGR